VSALPTKGRNFDKQTLRVSGIEKALEFTHVRHMGPLGGQQ
jgi:hypothetical protein